MMKINQLDIKTFKVLLITQKYVTHGVIIASYM